MKRLFTAIIIMLLITPFSHSQLQEVKASNNITINLNGVNQDYSNKAMIQSGTTLVPLRAIFEALNAEVTWNAKDQTIDAKKGTTSVWLKINSTTTKINGKNHNVTVAPKIVKGSTLVPLRFVNEALGATVLWDGKTRTVDILLNNEMRVHFIDVGQGDSTFVQAPNGKTMLIDGGTIEQGAKVVAYLQALGIEKIDYIVATHPDADHIGGLPSVIKAFEVGTFINSGKLHTTLMYERLLESILIKGVDYLEPKIGDLIPLDDSLIIRVLSVNPNAINNNDASIVLNLVHDNQSFLLMGDASAKVEKEIMKTFDVSATVLKVGHHGSFTSSSLDFLKQVQPQAVILSYGKSNSYGHPHQAVIENIKKVVSRTYATAEMGSILISSDGKTISIEKVQEIELGEDDVNAGTYVLPGVPISFNNCSGMRVIQKE